MANRTWGTEMIFRSSARFPGKIYKRHTDQHGQQPLPRKHEHGDACKEKSDSDEIFYSEAYLPHNAMMVFKPNPRLAFVKVMRRKPNQNPRNQDETADKGYDREDEERPYQRTRVEPVKHAVGSVLSPLWPCRAYKSAHLRLLPMRRRELPPAEMHFLQDK